MDFVIQGALYYDSENDEVVRPHSTCHGLAVDCTFYQTKKYINSKKLYSEERVKQFTRKGAKYIKVRGVKYFETESYPKYTKDLVLLSDLSELNFFDEEDTFH